MDHLDTLSDQELVGLANKGSAEAFDALYRRHRDDVLRIARRFTTDDPSALDATQDAFVYLLSKFPPPTSNRLIMTAKLTTLLYPVIKHAALHARKKTQRLRLTPPESIAPLSLPPRVSGTSGGPSDSEEAMADLLKPLSNDHREVVLLRFVDDLTIPEIAGQLNLPAGTVKSRLHHAIAKLRHDPATKNFF